MAAGLQIENAFEMLDRAPEAMQAVLRPVVLRAMQEPQTAGMIGGSDLRLHLRIVWKVIRSLRDAANVEAFSVPSQHEDSIDGLLPGSLWQERDDLLHFLTELSASERRAVSHAFTVAVRWAESRNETVSFPLLARLLNFALQDHAFMHHILAGRPIEPFLPRGTDTSFSDTQEQVSTWSCSERSSNAADAKSSTLPPTLSYFLGKRIQLIVRTESNEPVMVVQGDCTDISSTFVVLTTHEGDLRDEDMSGSIERVLLFGMNAVVRIMAL